METNVNAPGSSDRPPDVGACPYCGAEVAANAPYCWKCGKAQPGVPEADPTYVPLDESALMAKELQREEGEKAQVDLNLRLIGIFIMLTLTILSTIVFQLRYLEAFGADSVFLSKVRPYVVMVLIFLLSILFIDVWNAIRAGNRVNVFLICVIGFGLLTLFAEVLGPAIPPALSACAQLVTVTAFIAWQASKVWRKFSSE
jgi:hypothetical protein